MAHQVFSLPQVAHRTSDKDCWFIINGKVLDVTKFLEEHPGGGEVLMESAGKDATEAFEVIGHSKAAQRMLLKYQVGFLEGFSFQEVGDAKDSLHDESPGNEMTAFVIKDGEPKYSKYVEFFVPALVASFFFGYRILSLDQSY